MYALSQLVTFTRLYDVDQFVIEEAISCVEIIRQVRLIAYIARTLLVVQKLVHIVKSAHQATGLNASVLPRIFVRLKNVTVLKHDHLFSKINFFFASNVIRNLFKSAAFLSLLSKFSCSP